MLRIRRGQPSHLAHQADLGLEPENEVDLT